VAGGAVGGGAAVAGGGVEMGLPRVAACRVVVVVAVTRDGFGG